MWCYWEMKYVTYRNRLTKLLEVLKVLVYIYAICKTGLDIMGPVLENKSYGAGILMFLVHGKLCKQIF